MKHNVVIVSLIVVFLAIPLISVWAVWEGNAGIASSSDFPSAGMYAKSDMFPRNTIVEIRNLETERTIRAVITGSSGIPGLVAVLSPEAAAALNIKSGTVSRVRIRIPQAVLERPADGTVSGATLSSQDSLTSSDPDMNPAAAVAMREVQDPVVPLSSIATNTDTDLIPASEVPETMPAEVDQSLSEAAPVAAEPVVETESLLMDGAAVVASTEEVSTPPAEEIPEVAQTPEIPPEDIPSEENPAFYEEPEVVLGEVEAVLVPTEPNPPEYAEVTEAESYLDGPAIPVVPVMPEVQNNSVDVEEVPAVEEAPVIAAVPVQPVPIAADTYGEDFPFVSSLQKGSWYVQIGSYAESSSVRSILASWSKRYPLAIERGTVRGKDVMKVLVGPLGKDEYGAALERLRSSGFKDAFIRKGK